MPEINPVTGQVTVDIALRLPNSKIIPFSDLGIAHLSTLFCESIDGPATGTFKVKSTGNTFVDDVLRFAGSQGNPILAFRIGIGATGSKLYLPWQDHIVYDYKAATEGAGERSGHTTNIFTRDLLFAASRSTKVASRHGKISDIVQIIAEENGFENSIIEETDGEGAYVQSFMDDVTFIRSRILQKAINTNGRGGYHLYVQDNVLRFHSADYSTSLKDVIYFRSSAIDMVERDLSQMLLENGASGVILTAYDPYTGESREVLSDPSKMLRYANSMHSLDKIVGAQKNIQYHLGANRPQEVEALAQSIHEESRSRCVNLEFKTIRSAFVRAGDVIRVTLNPSGKKSTPWSGLYRVNEVSSLVDKSSLVSRVSLSRGEFMTNQADSQSISGLVDNVVQDDQAAPGQDINIKEAQSSLLTKGAGDQAGSTSYVTTIDPG